MNFKRFHESKNLFDESTLLNGYYDTTSSYQYYPNDNYRCFFLELTAGTYTILAKSDVLTIRLLRVSSSSLGANAVNLDDQSYTFTLPATETIYVSLRNSTTTNDFTGLTVMLNTGSTPQPYEPYSSEVWHDIPYYQHKTATDTLSLPAVIYPNDTSITVGLKGNEAHTGTPSPQNPVVISGTGDLETSGEHTGQYKIPISMGGTTTPVYLGEVQTTRRIKKLVLDGTENWVQPTSNVFRITIDGYLRENDYVPICTHYKGQSAVIGTSELLDNSCAFLVSQSGNNYFYIRDINYETYTDLKAYLAQQYAAGTPVTVWYVLAAPQTTTVNEPLMKIGDYSDSISNAASIPTTEGANSITVDTTVQPSEFTATWRGWHDASVKEKSENLFDVSTANIGVAWNMDLNNNRATVFLSCEPDTDYCFSSQTTGLDLLFICEKANSSSTTAIDNTGRTYSSPISFTTTSETHCIAVQFNKTNISMQDINNLNSMLNAGSTALPYEPYWD